MVSCAFFSFMFIFVLNVQIKTCLDSSFNRTSTTEMSLSLHFSWRLGNIVHVLDCLPLRVLKEKFWLHVHLAFLFYHLHVVWHDSLLVDLLLYE
jgi:hypothetical protein